MCLVSGAHQLWDETWELLPSLCCICTDIFWKNRDSACLIPKKPLKNSKNLPVFGVSFSQGHSGGGGPRQQVAWALLLALLALDPGQLPLRKGVALLAAVRKAERSKISGIALAASPSLSSGGSLCPTSASSQSLIPATAPCL